MRLIDADALFEVIEKSMAENPHKEKTQRAMHIHEHRHFLTLLTTFPTIQPVATDTNVGDTISRQAAIDALNHEYRCGDIISQCGIEVAIDIISELPTIQPEPKKGHWIQYDKRFPWRLHYKCSECGNYLDFSGVNAGRGSANFCPNCGADMREVKVKCGDEDTLQGGLMSAT